MLICHGFFFFFFNDTATTEIYTLSLHDALPIFADVFWVSRLGSNAVAVVGLTESVMSLIYAVAIGISFAATAIVAQDRKSTRLNSSHLVISYAVFCLKKKKTSVPCTE